MVKKKKEVQVATVDEPIAVEEALPLDSLRSCLEEVKTYDGVIGYILRNATSATIDLKDPANIIDYAILSSSAFDASEELSELFDLGDVVSVVIEGKDVKVLSLTVNENKVSVFLEKNADVTRVSKKLRAL